MGVVGQKPLVYSCSQFPKQSKSGGLLQRSLTKLSAVQQDLKYEEVTVEPCLHIKFVKTEFNKILSGNRFEKVVLQTYSFLNLKGSIFSVDRIVFENENDAKQLTKALKQIKRKTLKSEALTIFDYFSLNNNVVILIADWQDSRRAKTFFKKLEVTYTNEFKSSTQMKCKRLESPSLINPL